MKNKYYKTIITFNVLSQDPIPDDMTLAAIDRECRVGEYSGDMGFESRVTELTAEQAAEELLKQGSSPSFFGLEEEEETTMRTNPRRIPAIMTINGKTIKAKQFAFDGCHKIYLLDDKAAADDARYNEYSIYRIKDLPQVFEDSCQLRFISNWNLDLPDYVRQFEDAVFDGFAMERSSKLCMDVLEEYLP